MTIASELEALDTNLEAAKDAVEAKGGTVGDTGLAGLATEIAGIPAGGADPFELFGVETFPVEPTEVDYKYATMEWTFEPDLKEVDSWGMEEYLQRSLKLNGEYVYDFVWESWDPEMPEEGMWTTKIKDKFSDIVNLHYIKPLTINLNALVSGWISQATDPTQYMSRLGKLLGDFDTYKVTASGGKIVSFPKITLAGGAFDWSIFNELGSYPTLEYPKDFVYATDIRIRGNKIDYTNAYSSTNRDIMSCANCITFYYQGGVGSSRDNPFVVNGNISQVSSQDGLRVTPLLDVAAPIYIGNIGEFGKFEYTGDYSHAWGVQGSTIQFVGSDYSSCYKVNNAETTAALFPNLTDFQRRVDGRTGVARVNIPNTTNPVYLGNLVTKKVSELRNVSGISILITGGGGDVSELTFSSVFIASKLVTSVDMSALVVGGIAGSKMFTNCYSLTSVKLPSAPHALSLNTGDSAGTFRGCYNLKTLDMGSTTISAPAGWVASALVDVPKNCAITVSTQALADELTDAGFTNVTVASA